MTLRLEAVEAAYGLSQVLFGITLEVPAGRVVTLLGRNGMGKTTTVRAVMGLVPIQAGRVHFGGRPLHHTEGAWRSHLATLASAV